MRFPQPYNQVFPMQRRLLLVKRVALAAAMLALIASSAVLAQGGKAEPLRISFKRGAYSATISESVRGDEEAEYVLAAKQGQRLIIKLTSVPDKSSVFTLLGEGNDTVELLQDVDFSYSGVLPKTGDYFIISEAVHGSQGSF